MSRFHYALMTVWCVCFLIGASTHARDIWEGGWLPYHAMPLPFNMFWTALLPLDLLVAAWIWMKRRMAVVIGVLIMISDVAVNSYLVYGEGHRAMESSLVLQILFMFFVLLTAPLLWSTSDSKKK
jgi:hypothetical protein